MGMTYEQYWEQSPYLAVAYRRAYRLKREAENEQAWLQGLYVFDAFAVCLANAFAKRGSKKQNYIEKPIDIFPLTEREKKRREAEENAKMQAAMEAMVREQRRKKKSKGD
jgi:hypothetical protein